MLCTRQLIRDKKCLLHCHKPVLEGLIRQKFGFQGIIITDDLYMGAIARICSSDEATVQAIQVGADIALLCHHRERQITAAKGLYEAVKSGAYQRRESNTGQSGRILAVKAKRGLLSPLSAWPKKPTASDSDLCALESGRMRESPGTRS